ncbi:hypothetical protein RIF29_30315 [Crotalaria pallida]|uniref:Uncharacterized protein n=1 Tax=Crotalaria pallida TaxID=3830 RepID=A0AAN9HWY1_CROPI
MEKNDFVFSANSIGSNAPLSNEPPDRGRGFDSGGGRWASFKDACVGNKTVSSLKPRRDLSCKEVSSKFRPSSPVHGPGNNDIVTPKPSTVASHPKLVKDKDEPKNNALPTGGGNFGISKISIHPKSHSVLHDGKGVAIVVPNLLRPGTSDTVYIHADGTKSTTNLIRKSSVRLQFADDDDGQNDSNHVELDIAGQPELYGDEEGITAMVVSNPAAKT